MPLVASVVSQTFSINNKKPNDDFFIFLTDNMSVARKLFRLFKFFNEYVKMTVIMGGKLPSAEKNL